MSSGLDALQYILAGATLVLRLNGLRKDMRIYKLISKQGEVIDCEPPAATAHPWRCPAVMIPSPIAELRGWVSGWKAWAATPPGFFDEKHWYEYFDVDTELVRGIPAAPPACGAWWKRVPLTAGRGDPATTP